MNNQTNIINGPAPMQAAVKAVRLSKIAKCKKTGEYFNGRNFQGDYTQALVLPETTKAEDFAAAWDCEVEIEDTAARSQEGQARRFARDHGAYRKGGRRAGLTIRHNGKQAVRTVTIPAKSYEPAFIHIDGTERVLTMKFGELSTDEI